MNDTTIDMMIDDEARRVSAQALVKRLNRKLARGGIKICKARSWSLDLGGFCAVDLEHDEIAERLSLRDLEKLARKLGVLGASQRIEG